MNARTGFSIPAKAGIIYLIFMIMYGVYRFFPVFPLSLICATDESNFQHYKAVFYAFLIAALIEYAVYHGRAAGASGFWIPRLFTATFTPWIVFLLWYIAPAVHGKWSTQVGEIIYANVIILLVVFCAVTLEKSFLQTPFGPAQKGIIIALFVISIGLYFIFTYQLPWADVFAEPDWREGSFLFGSGCYG